MKASNLRVLFD